MVTLTPRRGDVASAAVGAIGVLLLASTGYAWSVNNIESFDAFVVGLPAAGIVALVLVMRLGSFPDEHYVEVLRWSVYGVFGTAGFIALVFVAQGSSLVDGLPLLLFMAGFGGAAGVLVGANRGRSRTAERQAMEIERQRERLELLNQLLRHNVLNKIAIIRGNAELLAVEQDIDDQYVNTILAQSDDVSELIDNVRLLVRSFSENRQLHPVDLTADLGRELRSLTQSFESVDVEADVDDDLVVYADGLLRYTFENVLTNAVEHNDTETPRVEVTAERSGDTVVVTVEDNGPGIPPSVRSDCQDVDLSENHGIGIYLVRTLLTRYDGSLTIADNEPRGSVVTLTFPAADGPIEQRPGP